MANRIAFIKPSVENSELCDVKLEPGVSPSITLTGSEAQSFYNELLGLEDTHQPGGYTALQTGVCRAPPPDCEEKKSSRLHQSNPEDPPSSDDEELLLINPLRFKPSDLLRCAQNGEHKKLKRILFTRKFDVNLQDNYGWSAAHCAAYEGHVACLKLLLKFGANKNLHNNSGHSPIDLARRRKKKQAYELLKLHGAPAPSSETQRPTEDPKSLICPQCHSEYFDNEFEAHIASIVHRSTVSVEPETRYGISETNVGFKMLESMGWEKRNGLGTDGSGRKFPIKTKLKRDREGLGLSTKPSRVTHFAPKSLEAVKFAQIQPKRKDQLRKVVKDKRLEKDFRRAFY